ncbi:hypothetical protein [Streptomyces griseoluteus]|uniref:hypothetical protein n=1 Tax=Streptomyces griseoluteus TaxID=29306 RepID=UPI0037008C21
MTDRYFLEERGGLWVVGVHERGTREVWERFTAEDQACRWLHDRLTDEGPPPEPPTPEEMDQLLHGGEGIQRRAREELDQSLAETHGRTTEEPRPDDGHTQPPPEG